MSKHLSYPALEELDHQISSRQRARTARKTLEKPQNRNRHRKQVWPQKIHGLTAQYPPKQSVLPFAIWVITNFQALILNPLMNSWHLRYLGEFGRRTRPSRPIEASTRKLPRIAM